MPRNVRAVSDRGAKAAARAAPASRDEKDLIRTARLNLLLIGMEHQTREVLDELRSGFLEPITTWSRGEPLVLPAHTNTGTLILDDITALGFGDQIRLLDWLAATDGRTRVVSISSRSIVPLIETGAFLSILYYRLNVVCLDMTDGQRRARRTC